MTRRQGEIARDDPMPPGPFSVGLTIGPRGLLEWPYTVRCGDGRAIAGHVNSRACAEAICAALNEKGSGVEQAPTKRRKR